MNRNVFMKATKEGEKLELTKEQENECKLVYKPTDEGEGYVFSGIWDASRDEEYPDTHIIVPLRSVYVGTFNYTARDVFANIIGSTPDHCPSSSWLDLLRSQGIDCSCCVTDGYFYDSRDPSAQTYFPDFQCGGGIIGAHVINGTKANEVAPGSTVLMIPICHNHNSCCTDNTGRNGSGFFMMPRKSGMGIRLKGYLKP